MRPIPCVALLAFVAACEQGPDVVRTGVVWMDWPSQVVASNAFQVRLVVERPWMLAPSGSSILALLGLSVFSTALAFVIYFRLIQTLGSVGTTAQAYLRVPIGVALGVAFLGETLSPTAWIGLGCIVIGVAAMTMPARRAAVVSEAG